MKVALLVVLLLGLAVALWRRFGGGRQNSPAARRSRPQTPYGCVSISAGLNACRQAEQVRHTRYLPREAPLLPLPGCDEKRCMCRYEHHADRRAEERRDPFSHFVGFKPTPVHDDKRRGWDRRRQRE